MLRPLLKSSLFQRAGIYSIANVIRQCLPVLLVPVLTHYLTTEDYGTTAVFGVVGSILAPMVGINVHGAISRRYFDRETTDFPVYVYNCLLIILGSSIGMGLLLWLGAGPISSLSEVPRSWLWAPLAMSIGQVLVASLLTLLQVQGRAALYATIQVGRMVLTSALSVTLVIGFHQGWRGPIVAQAGAGLAFGALALMLLRSSGFVRVRYDREQLLHALRFGLPLVPHVLSSVAAQMIDRLFVAHYDGLGKAGLYSLGYQLGALIGLLVDSFDGAFQPWLFERLGTADHAMKLRIVRFTYVYFAAVALIAVVVGWLAPLVLSYIVPARFHGAQVYVIWIALGFSFDGMYRMVTGYLFYAERTGILAFVSFGSACLNVLLNWLLVPRWGALGSAYATTASFASTFVFTWIAASRVYPMPWSLRSQPR